MNKRGRLLILISSLVVVCLLSALALAQGKSDLSAKEARRLIARMAGIELPSDAVRVKSVSALGSSTVVVAQVETAFRFEKGEGNKWRVAEIRTGDNQWEDVDLLVCAINTEKTARAQAEIETVATALEAFRRERGFYVMADNEKTLIDQLSPRYLERVIRLDPWHRPYRYRGTRDGYALSSLGPDGKPDTADDIARTGRD